MGQPTKHAFSCKKLITHKIFKKKKKPRQNKNHKIGIQQMPNRGSIGWCFQFQQWEDIAITQTTLKLLKQRIHEETRREKYIDDGVNSVELLPRSRSQFYTEWHMNFQMKQFLNIKVLPDLVNL